MTKFIIKEEITGKEVFDIIESIRNETGSKSFSPLFYALKAKEGRHLFYITTCKSEKGNRELRNPMWLADKFKLNEKFYEVMELDWRGKLPYQYIKDNSDILPVFPQSDSEIPMISREKWKELETMVSKS